MGNAFGIWYQAVKLYLHISDDTLRHKAKKIAEFLAASAVAELAEEADRRQRRIADAIAHVGFAEVTKPLADLAKGDEPHGQCDPLPPPAPPPEGSPAAAPAKTGPIANVVDPRVANATKPAKR